jgi:hypothetical protein
LERKFDDFKTLMHEKGIAVACGKFIEDNADVAEACARELDRMRIVNEESKMILILKEFDDTVADFVIPKMLLISAYCAVHPVTT